MILRQPHVSSSCDRRERRDVRAQAFRRHREFRLDAFREQARFGLSRKVGQIIDGSSNATETLTMNDDYAVTAVFTPTGDCTPVEGATLTLNSSGDIYVGNVVSFTADIVPDDASKPYTYTINYGDGTLVVPNSSSDDPLTLEHSYAATGTYTIEFAAWNCEMTVPFTDTLELTVMAQGPEMFTIYLPVVMRNH